MISISLQKNFNRRIHRSLFYPTRYLFVYRANDLRFLSTIRTMHIQRDSSPHNTAPICITFHCLGVRGCACVCERARVYVSFGSCVLSVAISQFGHRLRLISCRAHGGIQIVAIEVCWWERTSLAAKTTAGCERIRCSASTPTAVPVMAPSKRQRLLKSKFMCFIHTFSSQPWCSSPLLSMFSSQSLLPSVCLLLRKYLELNIFSLLICDQINVQLFVIEKSSLTCYGYFVSHGCIREIYYLRSSLRGYNIYIIRCLRLLSSFWSIFQ